jgi:hypothetical protein
LFRPATSIKPAIILSDGHASSNVPFVKPEAENESEKRQTKAKTFIHQKASAGQNCLKSRKIPKDPARTPKIPGNRL